LQKLQQAVEGEIEGMVKGQGGREKEGGMMKGEGWSK